MPRSLRFLGRRAEGPVARFGREAGAGSEGRGRGGLPRAEADQGQGVAAVHSTARARQAAAPWAGASARRRVRAMTLAPAVPPLWSRTVSHFFDLPPLLESRPSSTAAIVSTPPKAPRPTN